MAVLACVIRHVKGSGMPVVQVLARTICMQFEGNWTPVTEIVVDKVGKYAYVIGSPHDAAAMPVVMDVVLDVRTKVLLGRCARFQCPWFSRLLHNMLPYKPDKFAGDLDDATLMFTT